MKLFCALILLSLIGCHKESPTEINWEKKIDCSNWYISIQKDGSTLSFPRDGIPKECVKTGF